MQTTPRPIAYLAIAVVAGVLAIAATLTPVYVISQSGPGFESSVSYSLWHLCYQLKRAGTTQQECSKLDDRVHNYCLMLSHWYAMRAFSIWTITVCFLAAVPLSVADLLNKACTANARKIVMAVVGGVVAVSATAAWATWARYWNVACVGVKPKDRDGIKWGPMAPLMIVVMLLGIALAIVAMVTPGPAADAIDATDAAGPDKEQPAGLGLGSPNGQVVPAS